MAIIYTYPSKTDPVADDKVLISDSEDNNKTKTVSIKDIRSGTVTGVSSIVAGNNVTISPGAGTGDVTVNATAYTAGDGIDINAYAVSADIKANSGITIDGTEISLDLSASAITGTLGVADGGSGAATFTAGFLKANGTSAFSTVATVDLTSEVTGALPVANGGTGATTLTGILVGNGTSAVTGAGDINDLVSAQYSTASNGSMYFGTVPAGLSGTPLANTSIGNKAGNLLTTGATNTLLGEGAGAGITTGSTNVVIGARADVASSGVLDATVVGHTAVSGRDGVALGKEANAGRDAIAIGSGAEALANTISIGSANHAITLDATSRSASTFLPIKINGVEYFIQLFVP